MQHFRHNCKLYRKISQDLKAGIKALEASQSTGRSDDRGEMTLKSPIDGLCTVEKIANEGAGMPMATLIDPLLKLGIPAIGVISIDGKGLPTSMDEISVL